MWPLSYLGYKARLGENVAQLGEEEQTAPGLVVSAIAISLATEQSKVYHFGGFPLHCPNR